MKFVTHCESYLTQLSYSWIITKSVDHGKSLERLEVREEHPNRIDRRYQILG